MMVSTMAVMLVVDLVLMKAVQKALLRVERKDQMMV